MPRQMLLLLLLSCFAMYYGDGNNEKLSRPAAEAEPSEFHENEGSTYAGEANIWYPDAKG